MVVGTEEQTVKQLLQVFVRETIPEYIIDGSHAIVAQDGVQKLTLNKREGYWDVDGQIQGEDFQVYASELSINLKDRTSIFSATAGFLFRRVPPRGGHGLKAHQGPGSRQARGRGPRGTENPNGGRRFGPFSPPSRNPRPAGTISSTASIRNTAGFRWLFSGPARTSPASPRCIRRSPWNKSSRIGLERDVALSAHGCRTDRPQSGLLRAPRGHPSGTFELVFLVHRQGILSVLARYRAARAHREQDHAPATGAPPGRGGADLRHHARGRRQAAFLHPRSGGVFLWPPAAVGLLEPGAFIRCRRGFPRT